MRFSHTSSPASRRRVALLAVVGCVAALVVPAAALAAVYQYGCCGAGSGVVLSSTDGWKVRTSNNRNTPAGSNYCIHNYQYDGSAGGALVNGVCNTSQTSSLGTAGYSSRVTCTNNSGGYRVNVSCWAIQ